MGLDLDPNCLHSEAILERIQKIIKVELYKNRQTTKNMQNYPVGKRLNNILHKQKIYIAVRLQQHVYATISIVEWLAYMNIRSCTGMQ